MVSILKVILACVCDVSLITFAGSFVPYVKILNDVHYEDSQFSERTRVHREAVNHRAVPFAPLIITLVASHFVGCISVPQIWELFCVLSSVILFGISFFLLKEVLQEYWMLENVMKNSYQECKDHLSYLQSPSAHGIIDTFDEQTKPLRNMWQQGDYHKLQDSFPVTRDNITRLHGKQDLNFLHQISSVRSLKY